MKRIGFLSFGHWRPAPGSQTRTASDALLQTIELAQAAEDLGADGAFVRVHHFERQLASPFPLLAAIGGAVVTRTDPARAGVSGGHRGPVRPAPGGADPAVPRGVGGARPGS
jgi:alkanesulfonate monooxygenase SsuD/methylene tetrahydromethanopterin reductase-like flavin-dependent oxidoreductase (luciferase family)